jgi:hypothetical protein
LCSSLQAVEAIINNTICNQTSWTIRNDFVGQNEKITDKNSYSMFFILFGNILKSSNTTITSHVLLYKFIIA